MIPILALSFTVYGLLYFDFLLSLPPSSPLTLRTFANVLPSVGFISRAGDDLALFRFIVFSVTGFLFVGSLSLDRWRSVFFPFVLLLLALGPGNFLGLLQACLPLSTFYPVRFAVGFLRSV